MTDATIYMQRMVEYSFYLGRIKSSKKKNYHVSNSGRGAELSSFLFVNFENEVVPLGLLLIAQSGI